MARRSATSRQMHKELQDRLQAARKQRQRVTEVPGGTEGNSDDEFACRVAWSSGPKHAAMPINSEAVGGSLADKHKLEGNAALKAGQVDLAITQYGLAINTAVMDDLDCRYLAVLHCNRALAWLKQGTYVEAATDAGKAMRLCLDWPKPCFRLAQAQANLHQYHEAMQACRMGEALFDTAANIHNDFTAQMDQIAIAAIRRGSEAGFDGRHLEVRSAGDEAWLGRPAPEDPELDQAEGGLALPFGAHPSTSPADQALIQSAQRSQALAPAGRKRWSFRSLKEAVDAAQDGDRILLLTGIHNGMGESINISKRVLIRGAGLLGETCIDQRANCPTFRISRACAIQNLDIDMTGFREAVMVKGPRTLQPLIEDCIIRCSGDDAVNVAGAAAPLFRRCTLQGRRCGVRAFDRAAAVFDACTIEECGKQGVLAMDSAELCLQRCHIRKHDAECVVGMDQCHVQLDGCDLTDSQGPGIDLSDSARLTMTAGRITGNVGGLWSWDSAQAKLSDVSLDGGKSLVLLAQDSSRLTLQGCEVTGHVRATPLAREGIQPAYNTVKEGDRLRFLPAEEGPFQFIPNKFTRKM